MRQALLGFAVLLFSTAHAQDQQYRQIFDVDPYHSNGYFIVDQAKKQQLGIQTVQISIMTKKIASDGTQQIRTVESFPITDNFYAKADLSLLSNLDEGEIPYYHVDAYDSNGGTIMQFDEQPGGDHANPEPECPEVCVSNTYAWRLEAHDNTVNNWYEIEIADASDGNSPYYFYVPFNGPTGWSWWTQHMSPSDYGIYWGPWTYYGSVTQTDVIRLEATPDGQGGSPDTAADWQGYPLDPHTSCYAIRKDRGQWRLLDQSTSHIYGNVPCSNLTSTYNNNAQVITARAQYSLPELSCAGAPGLDSIGSHNWFYHWNDPCWGSTLAVHGVGSGNVLDWAGDFIACEGAVVSAGLTEINNIIVNQLFPDHVVPVLNIGMPNEKDPKLIPVPRTPLDTGLYEFLVVLNNGEILPHFESFTAPMTLQADFASFTHLNIYPVPVIDSFSVDFDLLTPMDINMTVVNNMGVTYYTHALQFDVAGDNKWVVRMDTQWPTGLYHAVFVYADGSSESKSFTVQ